MQVAFEPVHTDPNSSLRVLHLKQPIAKFLWQYHYHPEAELVCVVSGTGSRHVGYHKGNFWRGDLVLIGGNVPHSGFGLNSVDPHEEIVINFKEEVINRELNMPEFSKVKKMLADSQLGILFSNKIKKKVKPYLYDIVNTCPIERYITFLKVLSILSEDQEQIFLNQNVMPYSVLERNKVRLQEIFTEVELNYHTNLTVDKMAKITNMTKPAFCSFFKKTTEETFTEFLNRYRVDKACQQLINNQSISDSCYLVGFNSVPYFNRIFKKYTGKNPSEFKKEYR